MESKIYKVCKACGERSRTICKAVINKQIRD